MKTRLLIIIAVSLVMIPWIRGLNFNPYDGVMVDGITVSAIIVMSITIIFSLLSWFLFSLASKNIKPAGILLSIITGASLIMPFMQNLGPMAGIIVGVVAGFAAFMLQKKMINPIHNKPLIIAAITMGAAYFVLIMMVLAVQSASNGIDEWTGTAEGIEENGFDNIFNNNIGFGFFFVIVPSLIITGFVIRNKKINIKLLIVIGIALMIEGFLATIYSSFVLFSSIDALTMRPIEGIDFILFVFYPAFLFSGISGIFVTITGIIPFWKERTGKRDMRK